MEERKPHVVVVPALVQGHLIPFMELAKLLASQGLLVSYIATPGNARRLQPQLQDSNMNIRLVSLSMPPMEGVPLDIDNWDNVPRHVARILVASSHKLAGPFEQWLEQQMYDTNNKNKNNEAPPVCIISDIFTGWLHSSGAKFGIPTVVFHTSGAFAMSVMHSFVNYTPQKSVEGDTELFEVPALSFGLKLRKSDLAVPMRDPDSNPLRDNFREEINRSIKAGQSILINTFYELESVGIDHMRKLTGRPVWSIGPLLPPAAFDGMLIDRENMKSRGKTADIDEEQCLRWLDSRRPQSVVFVCFGSLFFPNDEQIRALAAGLEASGQAFVWAIRRSQAEPNHEAAEVSLPEGFEDRIRERGLIIWGWAPQLLILSHPSVGAFLSHCGWNSTLESVTLGVPMITWPMFAEQPFNSKLLAEYLGIGIQICLDVSSVPDEEEVRRAVTMLLAEEEGKKMRMRAKELRRFAKMAVDKEGSSYNNLQSFVQHIQKLSQNWTAPTAGCHS